MGGGNPIFPFGLIKGTSAQGINIGGDIFFFSLLLLILLRDLLNVGYEQMTGKILMAEKIIPFKYFKHSGYCPDRPFEKQRTIQIIYLLF